MKPVCCILGSSRPEVFCKKGVRVRINFSEVIREDLGRSSSSYRVRGKALSPHWGFGAKMLSKCKKIVYSLTLFGVRYKRFVELEV